MRERRETLSFLSFLPRRERPPLAGNQFPSANEKFVFSIALQIKPSGSRGAGSAVAQFLVCNHETRQGGPVGRSIQ